MNTFQIKDVMQQMFKYRHNIQYDCIPCDFLVSTRIKSYPFAYCVNDEPSNMPGSHWLAVYIEKRNGPLEFFCSFGRGIETYPNYFKIFANNNNLHVNQTNIDLQSIDSTVCGHHVLHFLYSRIRGISFSMFYFKHKKRSTRDNDAYVEKFVNRIMTCK